MPYSLPTAQIHHDFCLGGFLFKEMADYRLHGMHTQPVAPIDQGRPPLWLFDKMPEEMGLFVIETFHASF